MLRQNYGGKRAIFSTVFTPHHKCCATSTHCKNYSHQLCGGGAKVVHFARFLRHICK